MTRHKNYVCHNTGMTTERCGCAPRVSEVMCSNVSMETGYPEDLRGFP
jgi:hypothetical protein